MIALSPVQRRGMFRLGALAFLLLVVCVGVSYLTVTFVGGDKEWRHDDSHGHAWLHQELNLTPEEIARIDAFEPAYREQRQALENEFDKRVAELREILVANEDYTEAVTHAVHRIHEVHGRLQELAIRHYFEMLGALPPEKQEHLRDLAGEALSHPRP